MDPHKRPRADTAVIVHLFHPDVWPYIRARLKLLTDISFDVFVSLPPQRPDLVAIVKADFSTATIFEFPNRGRDVAPFLHLASRADRSGYEFLLKLHTKKSTHRPGGHTWFEDILVNLLPASRELTAQLVETLQQTNTGLIGPKGQYFTLPVNYDANRGHLRSILAATCSNVRALEVDEHRSAYGFFAGTMFWCRLDAISPILRRSSLMVFEPERGQVDGTLAHGMERAFSVVPEVNHRAMYELSPNGIEQIEYRTVNVPDWADLDPGRTDASATLAQESLIKLQAETLRDTDARLRKLQRDWAQMDAKQQQLLNERQRLVSERQEFVTERRDLFSAREQLAARVEQQNALIDVYKRSRAVKLATGAGRLAAWFRRARRPS